MLLTVTPLADPGPPSPVPPPTAPKPPKDNARLQRLLRKAAKRSGVQASPTMPPKSFRSTLSPVSEADLESPEPAAPKKIIPLPLTLPPRFQIRGVTHRVPSPYPKDRGFTFTVSEQQSISQFLSSPTPRQTPSPRPPETSIADVPQQDHVQDTRSACSLSSSEPPNCLQRVMTPKPTTPPPEISHAAMSKLCSMPVLSLPVTSHKVEEHLSPKTEDNGNEGQGNKGCKIENSYQTPKPGDSSSATNKDTSAETTNNLFTDQKEETNKQSGCCSLALLTPTKPALSPTPELTEKNISMSPCSIGLSGPTNTFQAQAALRPDSLPRGSSPPSSGNTPISPSSEFVALPKGQCTSVNSGSDLKVPGKEAPPPTIKVSTPEELSLLRNPDRARPPRRKPGGGWARLVKHLVVEPEEPKFPEQERQEVKQEKAGGSSGTTTGTTQQSRGSRANKMWDALLYHMSTSSKVQDKPGSDAPPPLPFFRSRLPLLLHRPRFDARKLKEAVSRPLRKVNAFFHRRTSDKPISSFNRTASGWSIRVEDAEQEAGEGAGHVEVKGTV